MTPSTKPLPNPVGFHTVTPALAVKDAEKAIGLYKRASGAERMRFLGPDGKSIINSSIRCANRRYVVWHTHDYFPH